MLRAIDISAIPVPGKLSEKTAFWGAGARAMSKLVGRTLGKYTPSRLTNGLMPYARNAEKSIGNAAVNYFGADPFKARGMMRGVLQGGVRGAASGAAGNALLMGGLNAAMANEGERGKAFMGGLLPGAAMGAGFGAMSGVGGGLVRNAQRMHLHDTAKGLGVSTRRVEARRKAMGWRGALSKAVKAPDANNPLGKLDQSIARTKVMGGVGLAGVELMPLPGGDGGAGASDTPEAPKPPTPAGPQFQPNTPFVYSQPQYYKASSVQTQLRSIDFTNLPSYHR